MFEKDHFIAPSLQFYSYVFIRGLFIFYFVCRTQNCYCPGLHYRFRSARVIYNEFFKRPPQFNVSPPACCAAALVRRYFLRPLSSSSPRSNCCHFGIGFPFRHLHTRPIYSLPPLSLYSSSSSPRVMRWQ